MKRAETTENELKHATMTLLTLEADDNTKTTNLTQPKTTTKNIYLQQSGHSSGEQNKLKTNWNLLNPFLMHSQQREQLARLFSSRTTRNNPKLLERH